LVAIKKAKSESTTNGRKLNITQKKIVTRNKYTIYTKHIAAKVYLIYICKKRNTSMMYKNYSDLVVLLTNMTRIFIFVALFHKR